MGHYPRRQNGKNKIEGNKGKKQKNRVKKRLNFQRVARRMPTAEKRNGDWRGFGREERDPLIKQKNCGRKRGESCAKALPLCRSHVVVLNEGGRLGRGKGCCGSPRQTPCASIGIPGGGCQ